MLFRRQVERKMQVVTLGGLGTLTFERAIAAAQEIYGVFDREFEEGPLDPPEVVKHDELFGAKMELTN